MGNFLNVNISYIRCEQKISHASADLPLKKLTNDILIIIRAFHILHILIGKVRNLMYFRTFTTSDTCKQVAPVYRGVERKTPPPRHVRQHVDLRIHATSAK